MIAVAYITPLSKFWTTRMREFTRRKRQGEWRSGKTTRGYRCVLAMIYNTRLRDTARGSLGSVGDAHVLFKKRKTEKYEFQTQYQIQKNAIAIILK